MAKMQDDDGNRFLLSSIKNRVNHSIINNLFNPLEVLNLHSNGVISVDNNKNESLLNKSHFDIDNVHETKSITYSNARFTNRIAYVSLQSLTAILCFGSSPGVGTNFQQGHYIYLQFSFLGGDLNENGILWDCHEHVDNH